MRICNARIDDFMKIYESRPVARALANELHPVFLFKSLLLQNLAGKPNEIVLSTITTSSTITEFYYLGNMIPEPPVYQPEVNSTTAPMKKIDTLSIEEQNIIAFQKINDLERSLQKEEEDRNNKTFPSNIHHISYGYETSASTRAITAEKQSMRMSRNYDIIKSTIYNTKTNSTGSDDILGIENTKTYKQFEDDSFWDDLVQLYTSDKPKQQELSSSNKESTTSFIYKSTFSSILPAKRSHSNAEFSNESSFHTAAGNPVTMNTNSRKFLRTIDLIDDWDNLLGQEYDKRQHQYDDCTEMEVLDDGNNYEKVFIEEKQMSSLSSSAVADSNIETTKDSVLLDILPEKNKTNYHISIGGNGIKNS
jgi:hypothetical protein